VSTTLSALRYEGARLVPRLYRRRLSPSHVALARFAGASTQHPTTCAYAVTHEATGETADLAGCAAEHTFSQLGWHAVALSVVAADGSTTTSTERVRCARVRREVRSLSDADRATVVDAFYTMWTVPQAEGEVRTARPTRQTVPSPPPPPPPGPVRARLQARRALRGRAPLRGGDARLRPLARRRGRGQPARRLLPRVRDCPRRRRPQRLPPVLGLHARRRGVRRRVARTVARLREWLVRRSAAQVGSVGGGPNAPVRRREPGRPGGGGALERGASDGVAPDHPTHSPAPRPHTHSTASSGRRGTSKPQAPSPGAGHPPLAACRSPSPQAAQTLRRASAAPRWP
jgi:hypothetical protein